MTQVSLFFSIFKARFLIGLVILVGFQTPTWAEGEDDPVPESATYKKALETFGGPSKLAVATSARSDLGIWFRPEVKDYLGIILEWNDEKIVFLQSSDNEPITILTPNVLGLEHRFKNKIGLKIHEDYLAQQFDKVASQAAKVLGSKADSTQAPMARWEQMLILGMVIEAKKALNQWDQACRLYVSMAKQSPPPLLAVTIPLPWFDSTAEIRERNAIRAEASRWLRDSNEWLQLLGASWLLDGDSRDDALDQLKNLSRKKSLVSAYATTQLWRTMPPNEFIDSQLESAISLRDSLFVTAQAGPSLLIAERANKAGSTDIALREWLRVVMIHRDQFSLSNSALRSALQGLRGTNRLEDAAKLEALFRKNRP